jgi:hypothetical protein
MASNFFNSSNGGRSSIAPGELATLSLTHAASASKLIHSN